MPKNNLRDFVFGEDDFELKSKSKTTSLKLTEIKLPPNQPRHYFDETKLKELAESIRTHGILEPLLVRKLTNGTFELVAGERRLRACKIISLTEVPVIIRELSDEVALEIALIENLQREDLNPLEETWGILQLLSTKVKKKTSEITTLLYRMMREERGKTGDNPEYLVMGTELTNQVISIFDSLAIMNWQSFVANRLPLLNLAEEIQDALMKGQLAYTKAMAISRLKNPQQREELLAEAISENLSLTEIKERIKIIKQNSEDLKSSKITLKSRMDSVYQKLKTGNVWADKTKQKKVERLLKQLENIVDS